MKFTAAELDFLLSEDSGWPPLREAWGLRPSAEPAEARSHGAASLIAREIADVVGGELEVSSEALVLARRLTQPAHVFQLVGVAGGSASLSTYLLGADGSRTMTNVVAPGVMEIDALKADESAGEQLAAIITAALESNDGSFVLRAVTAEPALVVSTSRSGTQWRVGDSTWSTAAEFEAELALEFGRHFPRADA
ncbi:MAG: hypothetical protein WBH64_08915 [Propionicimonas sp.]|mgnify:CR=1 FL=1